MAARARPGPARGERRSSYDQADDRGQAAIATSKTFAPRPRASRRIPRSTSETARRPPPTAATRNESFAVHACLDVLGVGARPQDSLGLAIPDGYVATTYAWRTFASGFVLDWAAPRSAGRTASGSARAAVS